MTKNAIWSTNVTPQAPNQSPIMTIGWRPRTSVGRSACRMTDQMRVTPVRTNVVAATLAPYTKIHHVVLVKVNACLSSLRAWKNAKYARPAMATTPKPKETKRSIRRPSSS